MAREASRTAHEFWEGFYEDLGDAASRFALDVGTLSAMSGGAGQWYPRGEAADAASEFLPVLSMFPPVAGDAVVIARQSDGTEVILGKIATAFEPSPLTQGAADALYVPFGSAYLPGSTGNFATGATVASTTSTTVFSGALAQDFTGVQAGTYEVAVWASGIFSHSVASGTGDFRITVDVGTVYPGLTKTIRPASVANAEMRIGVADLITGVVRSPSGLLRVTLEYKANTAGTISARNAAIAATIQRTA